MEVVSKKERAMGAIIGTLVGDALGVGCHWYYVFSELKRDYGEWISDYTTPKPERWHAGQKAGEVSQTGQVITLLLESLSERGEYDEQDFCSRLDGLLQTLDGTIHGGRVTDYAMRYVWLGRKNRIDWSQVGSLADTAEAAIRSTVLSARFFQDPTTLARRARQNIRLTHRDPFIAGQSIAFCLTVGGLINGVRMMEMGETLRKWATEAGFTPEGYIKPTFRDGALDDPVVTPDCLLAPSKFARAARSRALAVEPASQICELYGLSCQIGFLLPAAYYLATRYSGDFEMAVLSAINGGGNNMARAALTGALTGAMVGLKGIPERFISGLEDHDHLLKLADKITRDALGE